DVRKFLSDRLPEYLLPAHVVAIDVLPLNSNGKVDRKALAASLRVEAGRRASAVPRDATEAALAATWCEVLGLSTCGVHDNFFELGGHSLKAAQVVSRVRQLIGKVLPLAAFFRSPTIAAAARI